MALCQAFQDCGFPFWSTPNHVLICFSFFRLQNDSMDAVFTILCRFVNDRKVTIESRKRNKFTEIFGLPLLTYFIFRANACKIFYSGRSGKETFNKLKRETFCVATKCTIQVRVGLWHHNFTTYGKKRVHEVNAQLKRTVRVGADRHFSRRKHDWKIVWREQNVFFDPNPVLLSIDTIVGIGSIIILIGTISINLVC